MAEIRDVRFPHITLITGKILFFSNWPVRAKLSVFPSLSERKSRTEGGKRGAEDIGRGGGKRNCNFHSPDNSKFVSIIGIK